MLQHWWSVLENTDGPLSKHPSMLLLRQQIGLTKGLCMSALEGEMQSEPPRLGNVSEQCTGNAICILHIAPTLKRFPLKR